MKDQPKKSKGFKWDEMEIVSTLNFFKRENIMNRYKRLNVIKRLSDTIYYQSDEFFKNKWFRMRT